MASFIVSLTYTAPIEAVDALLDEHVAWLRDNHAKGHLVGWGRKVPREGGILLAVGDDRKAVEELAARDPFVVGNVAEIEVIEWAPGFLDETVAGLKG
ncbi:hypothetical protein WSK_2441 [Novosphingobium sp. Rr 2-17]|uniref:YciI family protein n=1 Tax=Novosphingobium sp. Rr 2-17 TaxID=555793 RepID=UPI000269A835|nr:YciI family protein [Novosphingobium sp. Rr 2-17]EIZ78898.1 hypothetical protein WSK_2441 [Novosphingobium sp. Rr 2-17]